MVLDALKQDRNLKHRLTTKYQMLRAICDRAMKTRQIRITRTVLKVQRMFRNLRIRKRNDKPYVMIIYTFIKGVTTLLIRKNKNGFFIFITTKSLGHVSIYILRKKSSPLNFILKLVQANSRPPASSPLPYDIYQPGRMKDITCFLQDTCCITC